MFVWVQVPAERPKEGTVPSRVGVSGYCNLPHRNAGNHGQILCRSTVHSGLLNFLISYYWGNKVHMRMVTTRVTNGRLCCFEHILRPGTSVKARPQLFDLVSLLYFDLCLSWNEVKVKQVPSDFWASKFYKDIFQSLATNTFYVPVKKLTWLIKNILLVRMWHSEYFCF